MAARVDFDRYANGAASARNVVLLPTGGFTTLPGTRFVNESSDSSKRSRLIPFKASESEAYILEVGESYARFFRRQARIAAANITASITNGTFTSNANDWDDQSVATGSRTYLGTISSTTDGTSFALGLLNPWSTIPSSGDLVVAAVMNRKGSSPANIPTGVTISFLDGGLNTVLAVTAMTAINSQASSANEAVSLWRFRLPDIPGATIMIITATFAATQTACSISSWALVGTADAPSDTDAQASTAVSRAATIDIPSGGVAVYAGMAASGAAGEAQTWTGATEHADASQEANARVTVASETSASASPGDGASFASAANVARCIVAASFGGGGVSHDSVNGRLQLVATGAGAAIAEQDVATSSTGVEHSLAFTVQGDLGAYVKVGVGSTSQADDLFPETQLGLGTHLISFTPSASPFYIWFKNDIDDPAEPIYIDDVSLLDNTPLQLAHDYTEAQLADIRYQQANDVLYLYHPEKRRKKLERRGHKIWSLVDVYDQDGPYGTRNPGIDLDVKQLIKNPDFEDGFTPWADVSETGSAGTEWDGSQNIVVFHYDSGSADSRLEQEVATGVSATTTFVFHFRILGSMGEASAEGMALTIGTTTGGVDVVASAIYAPGWHSITFDTAAETLFIRFIYNRDDAVNGGLGAAFLYRANANLISLSGTEGSVTATAIDHDAWTSADVGRAMRFTWPGKEPAWGIITAYAAPDEVTIRLRRKAPYADIPTEDWQLGEWSDGNGWPTLGAFFQSRAVVAGTAAAPRTMWFSQSFDIENFRPDTFISLVSETQDDDALTFTLQSESNDPIQWIKGKRKLLVGSGGVWVSHSQGAAITPLDVDFEPHAEVSSTDADVVSTEDAVVLIESGGRRVFDVGYKYENETFTAAELSILAEHVGRVEIEAIRHQRRPLSAIWAYRTDGRLAPLAYNRAQDIVGWTHCHLGEGPVPPPNSAQSGTSSPIAIVEDIAIIPGADDDTQVYPSGERDEVWFMVKRRINNAIQRYIEVQEGYFVAPIRQDYESESDWEDAVKLAQRDAFYVHSGITYSGSPTTSITGLDHLEGEEVAVLADGRIHPARTVSSGAITLAYEASVVQVGLSYDWVVETLKLPYGTQSGSGVGKTKSISDLGLALLDSGPISMKLVSYHETEGRVEWPGNEITFERSGLAMDEAIPLFTGETTRSMEGPDRGDVRAVLYGSSPLPVTVLAIMPEMEGSERAG